MQRHVYQQRLLCLGRPNAQTLAIASTDNFHKLPEDLVRAKLNGRAWTSRKKNSPTRNSLVSLSLDLPSKPCRFVVHSECLRHQPWTLLFRFRPSSSFQFSLRTSVLKRSFGAWLSLSTARISSPSDWSHGTANCKAFLFCATAASTTSRSARNCGGAKPRASPFRLTTSRTNPRSQGQSAVFRVVGACAAAASSTSRSLWSFGWANRKAIPFCDTAARTTPWSACSAGAASSKASPSSATAARTKSRSACSAALAAPKQNPFKATPERMKSRSHRSSRGARCMAPAPHAATAARTNSLSFRASGGAVFCNHSKASWRGFVSICANQEARSAERPSGTRFRSACTVPNLARPLAPDLLHSFTMCESPGRAGNSPPGRRKL